MINPTVQQRPDEWNEIFILNDELQSFNADAHIIQSHQHQPAAEHQLSSGVS